MTIMTPELRKRFCRDNRLPIDIFIEPYFTQRLRLYDDYFDCLAKYVTFQEELAEYASEQDYFEDYNRIKDAAIGDIKNSEGYIRFNNLDVNCPSSKADGLVTVQTYKRSENLRPFTPFL